MAIRHVPADIFITPSSDRDRMASGSKRWGQRSLEADLDSTESRRLHRQRECARMKLLPWQQRLVQPLLPDERDDLIESQVRAARPIVSAVIAGGALMLAVVGLLEATGLSSGAGYPWWILELAAVAVAAGASITLRMRNWGLRLTLVLASIALLGVFMSIPPPGDGAHISERAGFFRLLPMAVLGLMVRPLPIIVIVATALGLDAARVLLHPGATSSPGLYWLFSLTTVGFGLMLGTYRTDYAVAAFRLRRRLHQQANTDGLTGLLNRVAWDGSATEAYRRAAARGDMLALAFFDIDHFKRINDTYGHEVGDDVLKSLAGILSLRAGGGSYVARLGGEEFVVLFIGSTTASVEGFACRVRKEFATAAGHVGATVSAGIAYQKSGEEMSHHLRRADAALYEAKTGGRDRLVVAQAPDA